MIKGSIVKSGSTHKMTFDVPADGNYVLFIRKGENSANRMNIVVPDKAPVFKTMKIRSKNHKWDVPSGAKDNPPLVLAKGKREIILQKSPRSSMEPDITHAYLTPDWHSVLPIVDQLDKLLLR